DVTRALVIQGFTRLCKTPGFAGGYLLSFSHNGRFPFLRCLVGNTDFFCFCEIPIANGNSLCYHFSVIKQ
ncbi:hypothetical protein, partial [Candidatus Allofournierella excrementigallinarum]|uniref:hypothetical protein n=1 Tax=Candidatus Allofournierella excrementigallinarum TaxID=2838592 RepID=UPI00374E975D